MTEMSEEKARAIVKVAFFTKGGDYGTTRFAEGFIAGIEHERKRAEGLIRALKEFKHITHLDPFQHERDLQKWECIRDMALAVYEEKEKA